MNKTFPVEKKRPEYKPKPKKETYEVKEKEHEIHFLEDIPYILIGWPEFETPYAVDDKGVISYELTAVLRKKLEEFNQSENPPI